MGSYRCECWKCSQESNAWLSRTYLGVFGMINTWKDPLRECLEPLRLGHRAGLASGDIEVSNLFALSFTYICPHTILTLS